MHTSVTLSPHCLYSTWEDPQQLDFSGIAGGVHAEVDRWTVLRMWGRGELGLQLHDELGGQNDAPDGGGQG